MVIDKAVHKVTDYMVIDYRVTDKDYGINSVFIFFGADYCPKLVLNS